MNLWRPSAIAMTLLATNYASKYYLMIASLVASVYTSDMHGPEHKISCLKEKLWQNWLIYACDIRLQSV